MSVELPRATGATPAASTRRPANKPGSGLPDTTFTSSPVLIDGKLYAPSEEGDVYAIAAEPAYRLLAKNPLGERFRSSPAVANGRLYLRGETHLRCVGKQ